MLFSKISSALVTAAVSLSTVSGLNILITNDDGFGTSNIRELYKAVKAYGHNAYIVASATDMSGKGGTAVFTSYRNLTSDSEFGIIKAGAPSLGQDPMDSHIYYYNGTPATQVVVALDYILPQFNFTPDLVLSGPNFGLNLGPFLYTLSGTMGAAYTAIERGIPAIAISAGYNIQTPYYYTNTTTKAGLPDPATILGRLCANLAQTLITNAKGGRILPLGYGLNVNVPLITSFTDSSCINPPFVQTRLTGGAVVDGARLNTTTGLFSYTNVVADGVNACINGDCTLPGETLVLASGCRSSVSVFTTDYDAPSCRGSDGVRSSLMPLVQYQNVTGSLVGGLNGTVAVFGNSTVIASGAGNGSVTSTTTGRSTPTSSAGFVFASTNAAASVRGRQDAAVRGISLAGFVAAFFVL